MNRQEKQEVKEKFNKSLGYTDEQLSEIMQMKLSRWKA